MWRALSPPAQEHLLQAGARLTRRSQGQRRILRAARGGQTAWAAGSHRPVGGLVDGRLDLCRLCSAAGAADEPWLTDILTRLPDHLASKVSDLLAWNWRLAEISGAASSNRSSFKPGNRSVGGPRRSVRYRCSRGSASCPTSTALLESRSDLPPRANRASFQGLPSQKSFDTKTGYDTLPAEPDLRST